MSSPATFVPITRWVTKWPTRWRLPALDRVGVTAFVWTRDSGVPTLDFTLSTHGEIALALSALDDVELVLFAGTSGRSSVEVRARFGAPWSFALAGIPVDLRLPAGWLVPVGWDPAAETWVPLGSPLTFRGTVGELVSDIEGRLTVAPFEVAVVVPTDGDHERVGVSVGQTGIVLEPVTATLHISDASSPDAGPLGFRGVVVDRVALHLPRSFVGFGAPSLIEATGLILGSGGISGRIAATWPDSPVAAGRISGLRVALKSLDCTFDRGQLASGGLLAQLTLPHFEHDIDILVRFAAHGGLLAELSGQAMLEVENAFTLALTTVGIDTAAGEVSLSGSLAFEIGDGMIDWPTVTVSGLRIGADGSVRLDGGWIDLDTPAVVRIAGFQIVCTRVGFGREPDGRRWVGVNGALALTEQLPAAVSADGLRVIYGGDQPAQIRFAGLGVALQVPGAFSFLGELALVENGFAGRAMVSLPALGVGIDATIAAGHADAFRWVLVHLAARLHIPLGPSGMALEGLEGLLAINMAPNCDDGDWLAWWRGDGSPTSTGAASFDKWRPEPSALSLGAGVTVGTAIDGGWTLNVGGMLLVSLPGPIVMITGGAALFRPAPEPGPVEGGVIDAMVVFDGRASTVDAQLIGTWDTPGVMQADASGHAHFELADRSAWFIRLGQKHPESARVQANVLGLWRANAWLGVDSRALAGGFEVRYGDRWSFGPVRVVLEAALGAEAQLDWNPTHLVGRLYLHGEASIAVGPVDLGLMIDASLEAEATDPTFIAGEVALTIALPRPLKDRKVELGFRWEAPGKPALDDVLAALRIEHLHTTESWTPTEDQSGPWVPPDGHVVLRFARAVTSAGLGVPAPQAAPVSQGAYQIDAQLLDVTLEKWTAGAWRPEPLPFATWQASADGTGRELRVGVPWPAAATRNGDASALDGAFSGDRWPCDEVDASIIERAVGFDDLPAKTRLGPVIRRDHAVIAAPDGAIVGVVNLARVGLQTFGAVVVFAPALVRRWRLELANPRGSRVDWWAEDGNANTVVSGHSSNLAIEVTIDAPNTTRLRIAARDSLIERIAWVPEAEAARMDAVADSNDASQPWSRAIPPVPAFTSNSSWRLSATTRARRWEGNRLDDERITTRTVHFRTGGPPGLPDPAASQGGYPHAGDLVDLRRYVRATVPEPGGVALGRDDVAVVLDDAAVLDLYDDVQLRVRDGNGVLVRDGTLTARETAGTAWLRPHELVTTMRLSACTGSSVSVSAMRVRTTARDFLGATEPPLPVGRLEATLVGSVARWQTTTFTTAEGWSSPPRRPNVLRSPLVAADVDVELSFVRTGSTPASLTVRGVEVVIRNDRTMLAGSAVGPGVPSGVPCTIRLRTEGLDAWLTIDGAARARIRSTTMREARRIVLELDGVTWQHVLVRDVAIVHRWSFDCVGPDLRAVFAAPVEIRSTRMADPLDEVLTAARRATSAAEQSRDVAVARLLSSPADAEAIAAAASARAIVSKRAAEGARAIARALNAPWAAPTVKPIAEVWKRRGSVAAVRMRFPTRLDPIRTTVTVTPDGGPADALAWLTEDGACVWVVRESGNVFESSGFEVKIERVDSPGIDVPSVTRAGADGDDVVTVRLVAD